jgi:hypothetical protein
MPRRTTIPLDENVYQNLARETMTTYKIRKPIPKLANKFLKMALKREGNILDLILSEKLAKTNAKEFETFRRGLSKRFESRPIVRPNCLLSTKVN